MVLGNKDGNFGPPITTTIASVEPFAVGDSNGDGIPDVPWSATSNLYVYLGNGDGTFSAGPVTSTQTGQALLAADLNGDGRPDLVMAGMAVAMNLGGGKFGASQWYQNPSGNAGVAGDFRNLNRQDLIVAGDYYPNTGSGRFHGPRSYPAGCSQCSYLATGDFNNDGNLDAAVAGGDNVLIYAGMAGETSQMFTKRA